MAGVAMVSMLSEYLLANGALDETVPGARGRDQYQQVTPAR